MLDVPAGIGPETALRERGGGIWCLDCQLLSFAVVEMKNSRLTYLLSFD